MWETALSLDQFMKNILYKVSLRHTGELFSESSWTCKSSLKRDFLPQFPLFKPHFQNKTKPDNRGGGASLKQHVYKKGNLCLALCCPNRKAGGVGWGLGSGVQVREQRGGNECRQAAFSVESLGHLSSLVCCLSGNSLRWGRQAVGFNMETGAGEGEKDVWEMNGANGRRSYYKDL